MEDSLFEAIFRASQDFHNKYISPEPTEETIRIAMTYATYIVLKFLEYHADPEGTRDNRRDG